MKKTLWIAIVFFVAMVIGSLSVQATTLYIRSFQAFLMEQPNARAKKLLKLKRGTPLNEVEKKDGWVKVKLQDKEGWMALEGWVNELLLTTTMSNKKVSLLSQKVDIGSKARRRASSYSSTASARGLVESGRKRISSEQLPDYHALEQLDQLKVDETEAIAFVAFREE